MKKIAVTGANGFVGQHLVNELASNDYEVLAIGGSNLPAVGSNDKVLAASVDLLNANEVRTLDFSDLDAVIHLAGLAAVGPSFADPELYMHTNTTMQTNLFERALEQVVRPRFVVISSGSLYNPHSPLPITESSSVVPSSPYAESKQKQEKQAHHYARQGFDIIIARPFNHIGPGQNTGFLVPDLASQIVAAEQGGKQKISVGNLDAKRDYTDVRDIVRAYRLLVESGVPGETYNICSGVSHSGKQVLDLLMNEARVKVSVASDPDRMRPSDAPDIYGSNNKLRNDTGWQPSIGLEQTIHDVIEDWRSR